MAVNLNFLKMTKILRILSVSCCLDWTSNHKIMHYLLKPLFMCLDLLLDVEHFVLVFLYKSNGWIVSQFVVAYKFSCCIYLFVLIANTCISALSCVMMSCRLSTSFSRLILDWKTQALTQHIFKDKVVFFCLSSVQFWYLQLAA